MYPAVEYDFVPNSLYINRNDYVHIQWTGSNSHLNGNPAGDGAAGNDGNGIAGTDRNNLVQIDNLNKNYPLPYELTTLWNDATLIGVLSSNIKPTHPNTFFLSSALDAKDLAIYLSSSGYYQCIKSSICGNRSFEAQTLVDANLNAAPASLHGALLKFTKTNSRYNYMCSRNNNFSNRSQKGFIFVL